MPTLKAPPPSSSSSPSPSSKTKKDANAKAKSETAATKEDKKPPSKSAASVAAANPVTSTTTAADDDDDDDKEEGLDPNVDALIMPSLRRLTKGLPKRELRLMIEEAKIVEEALDKEIDQLKQGLDPANYKDNPELKKFCDEALESEITPADTNFTVSALLGRLRDDLAMPLPPNSTIPAHREKVGLLYQPPKKKKKTEAGTASGASNASDVNKSSALEKQKELLALQDNPEYSKEHPTPTHLMAVLKKISTHRAAIVFRRPVNPKEAPGYTDRILFPMDLSLVRKMIVARMIVSYSDLHQRIGLICHNCIKYNGRESDYGVVAREFEAMVDNYIVSAVETATAVAKVAQAALDQKAPPPATATAATATAAKPATAAVATAAANKKNKAPTSRSNSPKPSSRSNSPKPTTSRSNSPMPPPPAAGAGAGAATTKAATTTKAAAKPTSTKAAPKAATTATAKKEATT
ncbi:unnamed protein product [Cylindrotheca closterium]|uniref:Bromo domain-containing protein n=1 Tax=Cylindrotheca closterium TaxID=2856 RepID=A0AAD2CPM2_9STRA|nr:unnamed protein product [Cylindrotheca closterium]